MLEKSMVVGSIGFDFLDPFEERDRDDRVRGYCSHERFVCDAEDIDFEDVS